MREKIRELVIEAITDTDKLTDVVDKLCDLHNVSNQRELLIAFGEWFKINGRVYDFGIDESVIDEYISNL